MWLILWPHSEELDKVSGSILKLLPFMASVGIARVKSPIFPKDGGKLKASPSFKYMFFTKEGSKDTMSF